MPPSESLVAVPAGIIAQRRREGKVEVVMPPVEHAELRDAVFSAMARGFGWL